MLSPTYEQVCGGDTGHTEVVQVAYDPAETTLEQVLDVFWAKHDPTSLNRQGNDSGTQCVFWVLLFDWAACTRAYLCAVDHYSALASLTPPPPQRHNKPRYRAGIYTHDDASLEAVKAYVAAKQAALPGVKIVTEVEPVSNYSAAEDYHQQYLAKGGRGGRPQDPSKGCTDPIRCYG